MSVYVIASYDIDDPEGYAEYVPGVTPLLMKHGGEVLAADFEAQALEGERRDVHVILRFPTEEAASAWYNDPDYGPVRQVRLDSCSNNSMVRAREFALPGE